MIKCSLISHVPISKAKMLAKVVLIACLPVIWSNKVSKFKYIKTSTIYTHAPRFYLEWDVEYDELYGRLKHYQVVPSIISHCPRHWVNVSWTNGYTARIGNKLPWESVAEKPRLKYPSNDSTYFTILFTDYSDTVNRHPIMGEYQLWFLVNVPGTDIEKGEEHIPYMQPAVTYGHHRVAVIVYRQEEKVNMTNHEFAYPKRDFFCAMEVIYELNARLVAATVYLVGAPGVHNTTTSERPRPLDARRK